jgi:hypothetical protein
MFAFLRSVRDKTSMEMGLTKSRVVGRRTGNEIDDQSTGYYLTVAGQLFFGVGRSWTELVVWAIKSKVGACAYESNCDLES